VTLLLIQAAQAVATNASPSGILSQMAQIGILALVGLNAWQIKATLQYRDEVRTLRQWAFGPEGGNGVNSVIGDCVERLDELDEKRPHSHKRRGDQ
jgi:hypothetical protein